MRKVWLTSKFMTSRIGKQVITIHILPNILRTKGNQTMKFGQVTESNMRNIFFEKSYTEKVGDTSPRPFDKKSELNTSLD